MGDSIISNPIFKEKEHPRFEIVTGLAFVYMRTADFPFNQQNDKNDKKK
jgi:hypothetical protein